jgi:aminoglycoside 6'-N-acetyltransferase
MKLDVQLSPFTEEFASLLARWLRAPHVAPWYPEPEEHLTWALSPPPGGERAIIVAGASLVGYVRWQVVSRPVLDSVGLYDVPDNAADVDILIGEEAFTRHAIAPQALELVVARLQVRPEVPLLGLTTSVNNHVAHRAFRKAGFTVLRQYVPPGYGECHLMIRHLRHT